jgi:hypothetical protein
VKTLPNVREMNEGYLDFDPRQGCRRRPLVRAGASGWRWTWRTNCPAFLRLLRGRVKSRVAQAAMIGEVWVDASNNVSYGEIRTYCAGETLDSVMNYPPRGRVDQLYAGRSLRDAVRGG